MNKNDENIKEVKSEEITEKELELDDLDQVNGGGKGTEWLKQREKLKSGVM